MDPSLSESRERNARLIAEFVAQADVTAATRHKYRTHLGELAAWLVHAKMSQPDGRRTLDLVRTVDLVRYMTYLRSGDRYAAVRHHRVAGELSPSARKNVLASIHSFYRYLSLVGAIDADPSAAIKPPRVEHRPGITLTAEEVRALLEVPGGTPRERIQAYLLAYTAARTHELRHLGWSDVDLARGTFLLVGKRGKVRTVDIHPRLMSELRRWYIQQDDDASRNPALRAAKASPDTDRVLLTRNGRPVATSVIARQLTRRAMRAGLRQRTTASGKPSSAVTPHVLRRTFATLLLDDGHHIDAIADVLGHASVDTTRQHYAFASTARRRATVLAYDPQARAA